MSSLGGGRRPAMSPAALPCPYHSAYPCGVCDDCEDLAAHPGMVVPLCPGWSLCTCMAGTHGHSVAAALAGLTGS